MHRLGTMIGAARLVMPEAVYFTLDQVAAILHKVRGGCANGYRAIRVTRTAFHSIVHWGAPRRSMLKTWSAFALLRVRKNDAA